ncbi:hypothetical protein GCM10011529_08750 [Polymorphobacter glacialis]|uniref:Endolytic peptidoglycan transglycosylase RlpA n=1 Tax=Sandarakinorhabdus glacialis TaxID=1614636 RepID=A0A916ZMK1_9SPHN|nr:septal ring lytic transglycosylase RlpA family protein [Polymorphobacter glacialis]GGE04628.1 hypothetical protein GCM10011529_08750 [Polymorphobacter glacialis]
MRLRRRRAELLLLLLLAACSTSANRKPPAPVQGAVKIAKPYQVFGVWYYPSDDREYDQRGIASWYGPGFHALSTANGERYEQDGLSAAHKTLPLPSYVEVENLDNGRKLTVRINDRGPFVQGRIIDLSRRAAQLLGVDSPGVAKVRVRRVYPDLPTVDSLAPSRTPLPPPVVALPTPTAPLQQSFIQVAALSDPGRIAWLSGYLATFGSVVTERAPSGLTRIRLGPYADSNSANTALAQLRAAGYSEAVLIPSR